MGKRSPHGVDGVRARVGEAVRPSARLAEKQSHRLGVRKKVFRAGLEKRKWGMQRGTIGASRTAPRRPFVVLKAVSSRSGQIRCLEQTVTHETKTVQVCSRLLEAHFCA